MKNINLNLKNLFIHVWIQYFVHIPFRKVLDWFGPNWHKEHEKKIWRRFAKIKYMKSSMHKILYNFSWPNMLHIWSEHNPNHPRMEAALRTSLQTCKISQKVEFWNLGYRAIQSSIRVSIASLDHSERIPIINNSKNLKNW